MDELYRLLAGGMDVQRYNQRFNELPYMGTALPYFLSFFIFSSLFLLVFNDDDDTFDITNIDRFCKTVHQVYSIPTAYIVIHYYSLT